MELRVQRGTGQQEGAQMSRSWQARRCRGEQASQHVRSGGRCGMAWLPAGSMVISPTLSPMVSDEVSYIETAHIPLP
jgi:hypothetical protein